MTGRGLLVVAAAGLILSGATSAPGEKSADHPGAFQDIQRLNGALRVWLDNAQADQLFISVDYDDHQARLRLGTAVLRECAIQSSGSVWPDSLTGVLGQHLRRYRPATPWSQCAASPYDWEDVLVHAAAADCALYFDNGLVVCADTVWNSAAAPRLRLLPRDLRALFEACPPGTPVVILPPGWKEAN
jgi:hypothetical protein